MASPTSRTLEYLRNRGWLAEVVEKWNMFSRTRKDLFGIIDIVAIRGDRTIGIQATSTPNLKAREVKALACEGALKWSGATRELWLIGWSLRGAKGERKKYQSKMFKLNGSVFQESELD